MAAVFQWLEVLVLNFPMIGSSRKGTGGSLTGFFTPRKYATQVVSLCGGPLSGVRKRGRFAAFLHPPDSNAAVVTRCVRAENSGCA